MKPLLGILLMFLAFIVQGQLGDRIAPASLRPDFVLAVALALSICCPSNPAPVMGLLAGVMEGLLSGMYMGAFIVSRLVATLIASISVEPLNVNIPVAFVVASLSTMAAHIIFLVLQPTSELLWWLETTIKQSLLTGLLVAIIFPFTTRWLGGIDRDDI